MTTPPARPGEGAVVLLGLAGSRGALGRWEEAPGVRVEEQTQAFIEWWADAGIDRADLAVRRLDGCMIWHRDLDLGDLPLAWARAENVRRADVYVRPARGYSWPLVLLDDVAPGLARRVACKYAALVVRTSAEGGCHLWLRSGSALDEEHRRLAQKWLAERSCADMGSISGEHLGRLAGFKNWKRGGVWVNVIEATSSSSSWDPTVAFEERSDTPGRLPLRGERGALHGPGVDRSPSGREWGWVCGMLEAGADPDRVYFQLVEQALPRRGTDAQRYARRTVDRALLRVMEGT